MTWTFVPRPRVRTGWAADLRELHAGVITFEQFFARQDRYISHLARPWIASCSPAVTAEDVQQEIRLAIVRAMREYDGRVIVEYWVTYRVYHLMLRFNKKWRAVDRNERSFFSYQIMQEKIVHLGGRAVHVADEATDRSAHATLAANAALASVSGPRSQIFLRAIFEGEPVEVATERAYATILRPRKQALRMLHKAIDVVENT